MPSPWMSTAEAAEYLRRPSAEALRKFLKRHGIATARVGRRVLVARADLDRAIGAAHRMRLVQKHDGPSATVNRARA